ncbi:MAG: 23S rRNA (guanosine(2251)-2'-O)-methyltransferase RlmB [Candidatus Kryptoniota bacterium]
MAEDKIIGRNPVIEAMRSGTSISKIYVLYSARGGSMSDIYSYAKRFGIPVSKVDTKQFNDLLSDLPKHSHSIAQGVVATITPVKFLSLNELLNTLKGKPAPFLLILDRIQDPQNFGAILRTAAYFNVDGVVIGKEEQAPVSEATLKASAGAAFHVKIVRETNLQNVVKQLKENKFWIAATDVKAKVSIKEFDFSLPVAVIIGNEGSGVKRILKEKADINFALPHIGEINSLNVSVATGIICYEVSQQRGGKI